MSQKNVSDWATWSEIHAQPDIWRRWAIECNFADYRDWIAEQDFDEVWFCGAGTSAFIGDIIVAGLEHQRRGPRLRAVASTDLVAHPSDYLADRKPLVVSFGRSGNSSESIGTLDALDALAPDAPRLNITCNAKSTLATRASKTTRAIVLPEETHDTGFAMTSSFSTMLFTALILFSKDCDPVRMSRAADIFDLLLPRFAKNISSAPERAVFLGSGSMCFAARESALKVMELSAGRIPCLWDSTLGFRHGPKSFVTEGTEIVIFTCSENPASHYERDLMNELIQQFPSNRITAIGPDTQFDLPHPDGTVWAAPNAVLFAQLAGSIWAQELGLNVDNPFEGQGTLTRVVSGVKLYEVTQ